LIEHQLGMKAAGLGITAPLNCLHTEFMVVAPSHP